MYMYNTNGQFTSRTLYFIYAVLFRYLCAGIIVSVCCEIVLKVNKNFVKYIFEKSSFYIICLVKLYLENIT